MVIRETILQYVPVNKNESRGIQKYPAPKGENINGFEIRFKKSGDKKGTAPIYIGQSLIILGFTAFSKLSFFY